MLFISQNFVGIATGEPREFHRSVAGMYRS